MRILFISHEATRTGAPIVLLKMLEELKKKTDIYFELLLLKDGELKQEFEKICIVHNGLFHKISIKDRLKNIIRKLLGKGIPIPSFLTDNHFDLVYANTIMSLKTAVIIKDNYHIPFISHIHESKSMIQAAFDEESFKKYINKSSRIITVSKWNSDILVKDFNISQSLIQIVHPFSVFIGDYKTEQTTKITSVKETDFVVGLSGTATICKGVDLLPHLIYIIKNKYHTENIKFVWIGDFVNKLDKNLIMGDLNKLSLSKYFILVGKVNNPIQFYRCFDIFILLSREDSFPLVCLENASLSKPIICFDNATGFAEFVENDCGYIVPYLDINAVADKIIKLYNDKKTRLTLGNNAKQKITKNYSAKQSIEEIIKIIKGITTNYQTFNYCH